MTYDNDYVRRVATRNKSEGQARLYEPRLMADSFAFTGTQQRVNGNPDVFRNGEKFPIRITHLLMASQFVASDGQTPIGGDERIVQRYALRIRAHDTYYMNPLRVMMPLWANKPAAAPDVVTLCQSTWRFDKPVILGNRDAFEVRVALRIAPSSGTERISIVFEGCGLYSRQPKRLTTFVDRSVVAEITMSIEDLRNDGTEPMEVQSVTLHHTPSTAQVNPIGNIRNVEARIRLNGNGTNEWWNWRASTAVSQRIDAQMFGVETGRAIVHRLPGDGWLWYPNEGVDAEVESSVTTRTDTLLLAMAGYVMVM